MTTGTQENRADGSFDPSTWFTPKRFALILLALIAIAYPDVLFAGRSFYFRDFALFGYPLASHHRESFWQGEMPFWNPYNNCGVPFMAQWNTLTLYPGSLIYLLLPLPWSLSVFCLVHLFIAGFGMYWLARELTGHSTAAALAGTAFSFNGLMLTCLMWPNNMASLAWTPWLVHLALKAVRDGTWRSMALASIVAGLQLLGAGPEIILLTWAMIGGLWLSFRLPDWRACGTDVLRLGGIAMLGAGVAAVQLLPFLELLSHSQRNTDWAGSNWSMPLWGWLNFFVPLFASRESYSGIFAQAGQSWTNSYYPGVIITALALLAAWRVRNRQVLVGALLITASLAMAQGPSGLIYGPIREAFPFLGFIRFPVKFVVLALMILPLLAAYGLRHCLTMPVAMLKRDAAIGVIMVCTATAVATGLEFYLKYVLCEWTMTLKSGLKSVAWIVLVTVLLLEVRKSAAEKRRLFLLMGILATLWVDALTFGPRPNPSVQSWVYEPDMIRKELKLPETLAAGGSGIRGTASAQEAMNHLPPMKPEEVVAYFRMSLFENGNLMDHIPRITGFYSLSIKEYDELLPWFYTKPETLVRPLLEFAGVSHTQADGKSVEWMKRWSPHPLITGGQSPVVTNKDAFILRVASGQFSPAKEVYLTPDQVPDMVNPVAADVNITNVSWKTHEIRFEATSQKPAMLVVAQAFYPAWKATIDGQPAKLVRANQAFTALAIPAGKHEIRLRYEDRRFHQGAMISGVTVLLLLGMAFAGKSPAVAGRSTGLAA